MRERRERRQHHRLDAGAHAQRGDAPLHIHRRRRNRDDRVVGLQLLGPERQFADRAEHLVTEDFAAALGRIVVEQPDETPFARARQFAHEARARVARAEHDHRLALPDEAAVQVELFGRTIERARAAHRQEEQQRRDDQHGTRNDGRRLRHYRADHHDQRTSPDRFRDAHEVGQAREHPHAAIQAEEAKEDPVDGKDPEERVQRAVPGNRAAPRR